MALEFRNLGAARLSKHFSIELAMVKVLSQAD